MLALLANGYRPSTSSAGHHMTMIQSLPKSVNLPKGKMVILDALRRKRNAADYLGGYVDQSSLAACINEAEGLLEHVKSWIKDNHPELLE